MATEVLVAIITGLFGIIGLGIRQLMISSNENDQMENEIRFQSAALSFEDFLSEWSDVNEDIKRLFRETPIDRFLMLRAWNGSYDPRWTTAFFQIREGAQDPFSYVHFELDEDYVDRIGQIKSRGFIHFKTEEIPGSAIKRVYELEGVKASAWFFISKKSLEESKSSALTYCSFATHNDEQLTESEITRCQLIVDRIKSLVK